MSQTRPSAIVATTIAGFVAAVAAPTSIAAAQCAPIDFENLSIGTSVTTQYAGVTFDAVPDSCGGTTAIRIQAPSAGTSSGSRALVIDAGCPDFSPDFIRMTFANDQFDVSFTVGVSTFNQEIRAYRGNGTLISSQTVPSTLAVRTLVRVSSGAGDIRRIEVDSPISDFEGIDDLSFDGDGEPPTARIDSPSLNSCICGPVSIIGEACDGGAYDFDRLEYRPVNAAPGTPWSFVGEFSTPLCGGGALYTFDPISLGLPGGSYELRLTVRDACGNQESDYTVVRYDTSPPGVGLDRPAVGATVCGLVDLCGIVSDACGVTWTATALGPSGQSMPIASGSGDCGILGVWNATGQPAGAWTIRIVATDSCGLVTTFNRAVTLDPACRADISGDGTVGLDDLLAVLAAWDVP